MPEYAKGLKLAVTDRDGFDEFVSENAHDPAVQFESWGDNSVPEAIYISRYRPVDFENDPSYYNTYDKHVNGEVSHNNWAEPLLEDAIEAGVLEHTGEYDVDFVDAQKN